ncbi:hypothetical protein SAY87_020044 [Trapa incisa]|uniref:Origin recognition complex subunit 4 C-terminal domain-containing protein n=1 Tax=Trapa incisa TaxID=236973 RepID=A0AAN7K061_9MYRT|nr:hypothetical protein SAY87_020044 [Trapa incisa]
MASSDDNSQFMLATLQECGLKHKTLVFVLDEFDLFIQGKQRLLYALLDALQSISSQAVVIGVSCQLDVEKLLDKRVKSRFSHRFLLFLPPSKNDLLKLVEHALYLPIDSSIPQDYAVEYNAKLDAILEDRRFQEIIDSCWESYPTIRHLMKFLFHAVSSLNLDSGYLSFENFKAALPSMQRQPKMESLRDCSVLELYILVCMKRLEVKEQNSYNFSAVMKEYKSIYGSFHTPDYYGQNVCLRAFEHLLQCGLIGFTDDRGGHNQIIEFRPVKLLISLSELIYGLKSYNSCPALLLKLCA